MKHIKFTCDICREEKDRNELNGFEFTGDGTLIRAAAPFDSERHICKPADVHARQVLRRGGRAAVSTLDEIESAVLALPEREGLTPDEMCELRERIKGAIRRLREVQAELDNFLIDWMPANQIKELVVGDERTFVTEKKTVKCIDIKEAVQAIFEAVGGDYDAFTDSLSVNAIKTGAAKKILGDRFNQFFETKVELDLETSKPKKVLTSINDRFINR